MMTGTGPGVLWFLHPWLGAAIDGVVRGGKAQWLSVGREGRRSVIQDETDVRMAVVKGVSFSQYF